MAKRRKTGRKRKAMAARQPNGRIRKNYADRLAPTPEAQARREMLLGSTTAMGEVDCILDVLASPVSMLITDQQAEAGRRYAAARTRALHAAGMKAAPAAPRLTEWIDSGNGAGAPVDDGEAAYRWRKARMCVFNCGADVRSIVNRVCLDNAAPKEHQVMKLRMGLDALIRMWRI